MKQTIFDIINTIQVRLSDRFPNHPTLCTHYAWWLIEKLLDTSKSQLLLQKNITLTENQKKQLDTWLHDIIDESKPLGYVLGSVPFVNLDIMVEPPVLIPRPETEEWCIDLIAKLKKLDNQHIRILDMCTGSGCIALALAHAFPLAKIYAVDISQTALELAQRNAQRLKIPNIEFIKSDLFTNIPKEYTFDLIVSNPPYIEAKQWESLEPSVTRWEDKKALIASQEGTAILKKIIDTAPAYIHPNLQMKTLDIPQVMLEIGYDQGAKIAKAMKKKGYNKVQIKKDLAQKDRVVMGRVDHVASATL